MIADGARPIRVDGDPSLGRSRLTLCGRITVMDARELHGAAVDLAAGTHDVTVDCAEAVYLDTSAVQVLMALGQAVERDGRRCEIVGAAARLQNDFRLAGFPTGR